MMHIYQLIRKTDKESGKSLAVRLPRFIKQFPRCALLAASCLLPTSALASDPTPLFLLLVEIPLLILSGIFLAVCFASPKTGRILAGGLLVLTIFVMGLAGEAGYMETGGIVLSFSFVIDIAGIVIATRKLDDTEPVATKRSGDE